MCMRMAYVPGELLAVQLGEGLVRRELDRTARRVGHKVLKHLVPVSSQ